jgi:Ser/Thr protein kinase RdoA (MazF antagonist)
MDKPKHSKKHLHQVTEGFQIWGDFISAVPYGSGHINDTYKVTMRVAGTTVHYLMQRINHEIFTPEPVMENITRVTAHLRDKLLPAGGEISRQTLTVIPARDGKPYVRDEDGNWWRMYLFIEGAQTYDVITDARQAFEAARAFARFQGLLADLPSPRLHEIIPGFHNTVRRLEALDAAAEADVCGRRAAVAAEMAFVDARRQECARLVERHERGEIPERITHNDTKINNVMLDDETGVGVCVIDLDTVMPGLALYDFGDMVRTATAATQEDERDLSKVSCRINMFEALAEGYLKDATFLLPSEIEELVFSGRLITLTIGIRFLTDYLAGDTYFRTSRLDQNLDRCRVQFAMVRSMEEQADAMESIVRNVLGGGRPRPRKRGIRS